MGVEPDFENKMYLNPVSSLQGARYHRYHQVPKCNFLDRFFTHLR